MSHRGIILAVLLLLPAGCATVSTPPPDYSEPTAAEPAPPAPTPAPPPAIVAKVNPGPTSPPPSIPPTDPFSDPMPMAVVDRYVSSETWIPLERWCLSNHLGNLRRTGGDAMMYSFTGSNGTMSITIDSHRAMWRGADFYLGFAPRSINGHPYVHTLDVHKNFLPLLQNGAHPDVKKVIVLDPGHGGTDAGTKSSYNGHYEKEFTLDWAKRLQAVLVAQGWTVYLTRSNDTYIPLANRIAIADQHHAGLFLSLHFNSASPDQSESGLETYCLTPRGMASTLTRGYTDNSAATFPNNKYDWENVQYAATLHRAVLKVNGHADRGVRRARFVTVLNGQSRPALLMEGGFLSNPHEARNIADPAYRQKMAEAVAQALNEESSHMAAMPHENETAHVNPPAHDRSGPVD